VVGDVVPTAARAVAIAAMNGAKAGTVLGLAAGLLVLFQAIGTLSATQVLLNLPIAVQEMVLAVWLLAKGFGPKVKAEGPAAPSGSEPRPALTGQRP
jgi:thiamine transporter ThiT